MIAVDTNVLVYAHRPDLPLHQSAHTAVEELAEQRAAWCIPWPCVHEFLSVVTHGRIFATPTPPTVAIDQVRAWAASPSFRLLGETADHLDRLEQLVVAGQIQGPKVHDARIAAICETNGVRELWSLDRDLTRFPSLRVVNPLDNSAGR